MKHALPALIFLSLFSFISAISAPASAGGLSAQVARRAMCEDVLKQCMDKVRAEHPCKDEDSQACRDARFADEKQCNFLYSHCNMAEPPVKRIKPVFPGKLKKNN